MGILSQVLGGGNVGGTIEVYADPRTVNCRKVLAGLQFLEADHKLVNLDYFVAAQKEPEYVALNPNESLPAIKDGDFVLWESNAILQYAADKHRRADRYPTELRARADVNRWLLWESSSWFPSAYVYLVENCVKPVLGAEPDQAILDGEAERFNKLAGILDQRLSQSRWVCGNGPTIADIALAAPMHLHGEQKLPLESYPNITRWITEQVEQLPAWKATHVGPGFVLGNAA